MIRKTAFILPKYQRLMSSNASVKPFKILGVSSSLKKASCNTGLLRAAGEKLPAGVELEIFLPDLPLYNQDLDTVNPPPSVAAFREKVKACDALLFAVAEHNWSYTAALKNAVDWANSPGGGNLFLEKPAAIMGTGGYAGSERAQMAFRLVACEVKLQLINNSALSIANRHYDGTNTIDMATGNVLSQPLKERVQGLVVSLTAWAKRIKI